MRTFSILALTSWLIACANKESVCPAGQQIACACTGGGEGAQRCADDGSRFLNCVCPAPDVGTTPGDGGFCDGAAPDWGKLNGGPSDAGRPGLVYVNWCESGCTFSPGIDDARADTSSLVSSTRTLTLSAAVAPIRATTIACVESLFAPYHVEITQADPGTLPHREVAVGKTPSEAGMPPGVGGVAPFNCNGVDTAVAFVFGDSYAGDPRMLCESIAQQIASSYGLDHAFHCPDVMTYLAGCGNKSFTDYDAPCGEFSARECECGRTTQNSHMLLLERVGAAR